MTRKKIATVWLGGCSGCHMSFLDIDERLLDVLTLADIVKSPIVDQKEFPEGVDVTLVEGAVNSDEHLREINLIRKRSKVLVAMGDCAVTGNVTALRNRYTPEALLQKAYCDVPTNDGSALPTDPVLQQLTAKALPLHHVVAVDYYIPGCPPPADVLFHVLSELLHDRVPIISSKFGTSETIRND